MYHGISYENKKTVSEISSQIRHSLEIHGRTCPTGHGISRRILSTASVPHAQTRCRHFHDRHIFRRKHCFWRQRLLLRQDSKNVSHCNAVSAYHEVCSRSRSFVVFFVKQFTIFSFPVDQKPVTRIGPEHRNQHSDHLDCHVAQIPRPAVFPCPGRHRRSDPAVRKDCEQYHGRIERHADRRIGVRLKSNLAVQILRY